MKWTERTRAYINKSRWRFLYSRDMLIFLFFCLLSFVFWIFLTQPADSEYTEHIPLVYENTPANIEVVQQPEYLEVKYIREVKHFWSKRAIAPLTLDFSDYYAHWQDARWSVDLTERFRMELDSLFENKTVISITPTKIDIEQLPYSKEVPVVFEDSSLNVNAKYTIGDISLSPEKLTLFGHKTVLDTIDTIHVRYDINDDIKSSIEHYAVSPQLPKHTKSQPESLELNVTVEPFTEKQIVVPVWVLGLPKSVKVRTIPSEVKITYNVGISRFDKTSASDFVVGITYEELLKSNTRSVFLDVIQRPDGITNMRISPEKVKWMIELSN